jgi:hypothetical protein
MKSLLRTLSIGLTFAAGIAPLCLNAQAVRGPVLGFVSDAAGTAVRPLIGVAGASGVGDRLALNVGVRRVHISPTQDYVLALLNESKAVALIDLTASGLSPRPLAFPGVADIISISPSGTAAAIYDGATRRIHTIGGLPAKPGQVRTFDVSSLFERVTAVAVSDDGTLALVRTEKANEGAQFLVVGDAGLSWKAPTDNAAIAFVPGRNDIVIADNLTKSVFLVTDLGRSYARLPVFTSADDAAVFSYAAAAADGSRVFATTESGAVAIAHVNTGEVTWLSCECRPTTLEPLKGPSLFRLTEASATEPIIGLDASAPEPRLVLTLPNRAQ